ncbi:NAD(P)-binding domain-containing protein [Streptomyces sp. NPDC058457]|uniref:NAD(P)-binding domain-containing protein n=1 Tax=Streptomyces sp. NPDC058457 TaxID=3346507 RepID=UPI003647B6F3
MEQIAFLGLGHMGAPMARRLLAAGHPLTVWNRTAAKDLTPATKPTGLPALEAVLADYRRAADDPALAQADISRAAARIRTP